MKCRQVRQLRYGHILSSPSPSSKARLESNIKGSGEDVPRREREEKDGQGKLSRKWDAL